jgi:hypothetical protein
MAEKEGAGSRIVKFAPVIALNTFDGVAKLGFYISKKIPTMFERCQI